GEGAAAGGRIVADEKLLRLVFGGDVHFESRGGEAELLEIGGLFVYQAIGAECRNRRDKAGGSLLVGGQRLGRGDSPLGGGVLGGGERVRAFFLCLRPGNLSILERKDLRGRRFAGRRCRGRGFRDLAMVRPIQSARKREQNSSGDQHSGGLHNRFPSMAGPERLSAAPPDRNAGQNDDE